MRQVRRASTHPNIQSRSRPSLGRASPPSSPNTTSRPIGRASGPSIRRMATTGAWGHGSTGCPASRTRLSSELAGRAPGLAHAPTGPPCTTWRAWCPSGGSHSANAGSTRWPPGGRRRRVAQRRGLAQGGGAVVGAGGRHSEAAWLDKGGRRSEASHDGGAVGAGVCAGSRRRGRRRQAAQRGGSPWRRRAAQRLAAGGWRIEAAQDGGVVGAGCRRRRVVARRTATWSALKIGPGWRQSSSAQVGAPQRGGAEDGVVGAKRHRTRRSEAAPDGGVVGDCVGGRRSEATWDGGMIGGVVGSVVGGVIGGAVGAGIGPGRRRRGAGRRGSAQADGPR